MVSIVVSDPSFHASHWEFLIHDASEALSMAEGSPKQAIMHSGVNNNVFHLRGNLSNTSHSLIAAPKLLIKLEDKNFLLWNQQVEGIITS